MAATTAPTVHPHETPAQLPSTPEQVREAASAFRIDYSSVRDQIARAVVGQAEVIDQVLTCLFCSGHVLLEGVPGIGKTLLIRSLAQSLSLSFSRIQFTPDLMPADISGTNIVTESDSPDSRSRTRTFSFQPGPVFAQIVLADEINRATPKTQSALLEAMQERSVTIAGVTHALPRPFFVMATQNPLEQEGTYPLPEAQLDRFFFKILVGYSGRRDLSEILTRTTTAHEARIEPVLDAARLLHHQGVIRRVAIADHVQDYAVRLVLATQPAASSSTSSAAGDDDRGRSRSASAGPLGAGRSGAEAEASFATPLVNRYVRFGASPRAAQSIVLAAKCRALLDSRPAASIDDIRSVAAPALRHRILLNFEAEAEGVTTDALVRNIVETLPIDVPMPAAAHR